MNATATPRTRSLREHVDDVDKRCRVRRALLGGIFLGAAISAVACRKPRAEAVERLSRRVATSMPSLGSARETATSASIAAASQAAPPSVQVGHSCAHGSRALKWLPARAVGEGGHDAVELSVVTLGHHQDAIRSVATIDDARFVSGSDDGRLKTWSLCANEQGASFRLSDTIQALAVTPRGGLVAGDWRGKLVALPSLRGPLEQLRCCGPGIKALALSPDGTELAVGGFSNSVTLFDVAAPKHPRLELGKGHDLIYSAAWSHDGRLLVVGSKDGTLQLFDVTDRQVRPRAELNVGPRIVFSLALSRDDRWLVGALSDDRGSNENIVAIWDVQELKLVRKLAGHTDFIYAVALSPGGIIASAGLDRTLRLWSLNTGAALAVARDATERINALAFASSELLLTAAGDGKLGGRAGADNSLRLYRLGPGLRSAGDSKP